MALVDYNKKNSIVTITINNPNRLNAVGREVTEGITDACKKYEDDKDARVAILTGTGRSFCAGVDLNEVVGPQIIAQSHIVVRSVTKPVIAAVNGYAIGTGLFLMVACDMTIAAKSASFGAPEITRAIPLRPERLLAQGIPTCIIMELFFTGERINAQRAYDVGLINKVVPDEDLMFEAMKMAEKIAELSPWAVHLIKEAKIEALAISKDILDKEEELRVMARKTEDLKEAVTAFREKRKPVFKGK